MSEDLHNIDDLFKKAIDEHEDTPSPKVWDAIDKNLDKNKVISISRKYNKLKWAAAILLLFSSGMAMYVWQTRMKNKELVKQNNINKASRSKTEIKNNNDNTATLSQINTPAEKNSEQKNEQVTDATTKAAEEKGTELLSSQQKITTLNKEQTKQYLVPNENEKQLYRAEKNNQEQDIKTRETIPASKEETKEADYKVIAEKYFANVPMIFRAQPQLNGIGQVRSLNPFLYTPAVIATDNAVVKNSSSKPAKNNIRRSTTASPFSATVFFSPEFISNNVKDDHPRYREDNRHEIKNSEKIRSSSSYGVLLDYNLGKLSLQSGVSVFTRISDITPKTIYARPDNGGNVNYRISCSAGSAYVPLKSGATPAQGDSTKVLSAKNTLQYVSIPLAVKVTLGKGKFNIVPGVGIAANILSKGKVETVIAATGGNESSSTNNIEGLKSAYFNSQLSLGAEYQLSKKIALSFTPAAKFALSSINKDAAVKTKINSFGLSAGIKIKL